MSLGPDKLARLSTLLDTALDLAPEEREGWLASLAGEDADLASTLRELLAKSDLPETLRMPSAANVDAVRDAALAANAADNIVGPYRTLRVIGHGGMGEVWLAERADGTLKRKVALKLPYLGWAHGLSERFAREREILEALDHPLIARLYDAGFDARGRPYMALEYVEGVAITAYCDEHALGTRQRVALLLQVADAIAFAHSRLVLHRDLKPANILVTANGEVRLLDFGIAKLMERGRAEETALTQASGRALTPDYASPEQIRGEPIGTASDVYSLGVVAYEILAGVRPYRLKRGTPAELEQAIVHEDVPPASEMATTDSARDALRGDLDAILNKALKKSSEERYATVDALAQDLRNYLDGTRVLARPDTLAYRAARFARKHRWPLTVAAATAGAFVLAFGFGAAAVVIVVLLAGTIVAAWQAKLARERAHAARVEAHKADAVKQFLLEIFETNSHLHKDPLLAQRTTARELLDIGVGKINQSLRDAPEARAEILGTLGTLYWGLGLRTDATRLHRQAVDLARSTFGALDLRFARIAVDCARTLEESPDRADVRGLLEEAKDALLAAGHADTFDRGVMLRGLAAYYRYESLPDLLRTSEEAAEILVRTDPHGGQAVNALRIAGRARLIEGTVAAAERHYRRALQLPQPEGVTGEAWRLNAYGEHAEALLSLGRLAEAERQARVACDIADATYGDKHRSSLVLRARLANLLVDIGRPQEAQALIDAIGRTMSENLREFDDQFRSEIAAYGSMPFVLRGRPDLSEPFQIADRDDLARYYANSYVLAQREADLADLASTYGRADEARALLAASRKRWRHYAGGLGRGSPTECGIAAVEARLELSLGRAEDAWRCVTMAAAPTTVESGRFAKRALDLAATRAEVELARGTAEAARDLAGTEYEALRQTLGSFHLPHKEARLLVVRGRAHRALGDRDAADADLRAALALRRAHDDPASLWLADVVVALAENAALDRSDEARTLIAEARSIYAQHPPLSDHILAPLEGVAAQVGAG